MLIIKFDLFVTIRYLESCPVIYIFDILFVFIVCNIKLTKELCEDEFGYNRFVEPPHNCEPREGDLDPVHTVNEAKKSFLSGHSSFSFYCATFLVIYLHARLSKTASSYSMKKKKDQKRALKIIYRYVACNLGICRDRNFIKYHI